MATADSKINKIVWIINSIGINKIISLDPILPNRVNNKCPAIILAVNRIVKVIGRIIFLIDSIRTINGIKIPGVPWGIIWINICCELLIHPYIINLNHKGKEIDKDKVKWLVLVKI